MKHWRPPELEPITKPEDRRTGNPESHHANRCWRNWLLIAVSLILCFPNLGLTVEQFEPVRRPLARRCEPRLQLVCLDRLRRGRRFGFHGVSGPGRSLGFRDSPVQALPLPMIGHGRRRAPADGPLCAGAFGSRPALSSIMSLRNFICPPGWVDVRLVSLPSG